MLGNTELMVVLLLALILFGPERLPDLARQLGEAIAGLRDSVEDGFKKQI
jgi:TatA/E family protein of Tat protein translocase